MNTAPQIPRKLWPLHPNFPDQTLLLGSHENFRALALHVRELASRDPEAAQRLFKRWMYAMGNHERYEESKLYPYLTRRWEVSMAPLVDGHEELGAAKARVSDSFEGVTEREGGPDERARLDAALLHFREVLVAHLELEEQTVIPLLLELSPREFADYYLLPIDTLLAGLA